MSSFRTFLIGGGWEPQTRNAVYGPFLAAAGSNATVGCIVVDEGDGAGQFARWASALTDTAVCTPRPILVPLGDVLDVQTLDGCQGVLVCGGLTPAYAASLTPVAAQMRDLLDANAIPYAGFSAGSAIAAGPALVGGWRDHDVQVCSPDAAEDLSELTVLDGLGLVPFAVDVHAAQWGTLSRLIAAVRGELVGSGVAIDENTSLATALDGSSEVHGSGRVHFVRPTDHGSVLVTSLESGAVPLNLLGVPQG